MEVEELLLLSDQLSAAAAAASVVTWSRTHVVHGNELLYTLLSAIKDHATATPCTPVPGRRHSAVAPLSAMTRWNVLVIVVVVATTCVFADEAQSDHVERALTAMTTVTLRHTSKVILTSVVPGVKRKESTSSYLLPMFDGLNDLR